MKLGTPRPYTNSAHITRLNGCPKLAAWYQWMGRKRLQDSEGDLNPHSDGFRDDRIGRTLKCVEFSCQKRDVVRMNNHFEVLYSYATDFTCVCRPFRQAGVTAVIGGLFSISFDS